MRGRILKLCALPSCLKWAGWVARALAITAVLSGVADAAEQIPDIVVTSPQSVADVGDVQPLEFTGQHSTVERRRLARGRDTLAAIIAETPGVQFRQSGGEGSYSTIALRGSSSAQTAVFLDGVPLNDASTGSVDLSQLDRFNLGAIDIYRGTTPMALGSGTLGGAINLRTIRHDRPTTEMRIGLGSFGSESLSIGHSREWGHWQLLLNLSSQSSDNDFRYIFDNGTPLNTADDRRVTRAHARYQRRSLLLKFGGPRDVPVQQDVLLQLTSRERQLPDWQNRVDTRSTLDNDTLQLHYTRRRHGERWSTRQRSWLNRNTEHYQDRGDRIGLGVQESESTTHVIGVSHYQEQLEDTGTLSLQLQTRLEWLDHQDLVQARDWEAHRAELEAAAQYVWFGEGERDAISLALLGQALQDRWDAEAGTRLGGEASAHSLQWLPRLGWRRALKAQWSLSANLGRYHREPGFQERFGDRGFYVGNPELEAEYGYNSDIALRWQDEEVTAIELALFANQRDELIAVVHDGQGVGRSENVGRARMIGLELDAHWRWQRWGLQGALSWQDAENRSNVPAYRGKQLPNQAQLSAQLRLDLHFSRWQLWYQVQDQHGRYYDNANLLSANDPVLHALGGTWSRGPFTVEMSLENLTDENPEDFNAYPRPGRSVQLALQWLPSVKP